MKTDPSQARILVVDDEPANVRLLERMPAEAGYRQVKGTTDSRQVQARSICVRSGSSSTTC